jgi:hypothetical protein
MASERSFQDRCQRARSLHDGVALLTPAYAPPDPGFTLAALATALAAADAANSLVTERRALHQDAVSDRKALVKALGPLVTRSLCHVRGNSAWAPRLEAVKNAADKVRGTRPRRKRKPTDPPAPRKPRQMAERSYVEIAAHLQAYIARLAALPGYAPADDSIKLPALEALHLQLDALNQNLSTLRQSLADAIHDRADAHRGPAGLKSVFLGVKTSVRGQYPRGSLHTRAISAMRW